MEHPVAYNGHLPSNGSGPNSVQEPDLLLFAPESRAEFTFIDLFAGIGGMRKAFSAVGGDCVYSSEWDLPAQKTYFENYGDTPEGDIRQIAPALVRKDCGNGESGSSGYKARIR